MLFYLHNIHLIFWRCMAFERVHCERSKKYKIDEIWVKIGEIGLTEQSRKFR